MASVFGCSFVYAQTVPVTEEEERGTCDPAVMKIINNQAHEAAQRELTQNENYTPRPDSVLSMTCFDEWLNHQAYYSATNFPEDPDESSGKKDATNFKKFFLEPDKATAGASPLLAKGYAQFALLEVLVLDQLVQVDGMSGGSKSHYIADNFPEFMIGDRAKEQSAVPAYSKIYSKLNTSVSTGSSYNCKMMNDVWKRTKCYDFATESARYKSNHSGSDHDGFYLYDSYVSGSDYRTEPDSCSSWGSWSSVDDAANASSGDSYKTYLDMVSENADSCSDPIPTGFIVLNGKNQHYDAICPNPGCHFNPSSSLSGSGTCSK